MQQKTRWMAICLAVGLCTGPVGATMITSLQSGQTWSGNIVAGSGLDVTLPTSSPWTTTDGFVFSSPNGNISLMPYIGAGSSGLTTNNGEIDITTPVGGETAMYLLLGVWDGSSSWLKNLTVDVELSDGETFTTLPYNANFWFSSSTPITSVKLLSSTSGDEPFIDAISYGTSSLPPDNTNSGGTSPIPEPATVLLVSGGALILLGTRRRWFRRAA